jgi:hypothetical protein
MAGKSEIVSQLDQQILFDLATIHAYVVSRETTKSLQAYTFEQYLTEAKNQIKSDKEGLRPTKLDRLQRISDLLNNTIDKVKQFNKEQKDSVESTKNV